MVSEPELLGLLEQSWPPERSIEQAGLRLRLAPGAGSRVNSARFLTRPGAAAASAAIALMTRFYRDCGITPLAQIGADDAVEAAALSAAGYFCWDPCDLLIADAAAVTSLASRPTRAMVLDVATPLAALDRLWADGDGGPERRAIMRRVGSPSQVLAARHGDRLGGAVFVACPGRVAFAHALHVSAPARRVGLGRDLMVKAAGFAAACGAEGLAVSVRVSNTPAQQLFTDLGFRRHGGYAYWRCDPL